jgi:hypothetical protein
MPQQHLVSDIIPVFNVVSFVGALYSEDVGDQVLDAGALLEADLYEFSSKTRLLYDAEL